MAHVSDIIVIGGGLMGSCVASRLAQKKIDVTMLDEGDLAFRSARGNFGLVCTQSKGLGMPGYVAWTIKAAHAWNEWFADFLVEETGIDIQFQYGKGLFLCHGDEEFEKRKNLLTAINDQDNPKPTVEFLTHQETQDFFPNVALGKGIVGSSLCLEEGCLNPLYLLRALHSLFIKHNGTYKPNSAVQDIRFDRTAEVYTLTTQSGVYQTKKIVIAAGNNSVPLAQSVGVPLSLNPQHGQILALSRTKPLFDIPMSGVRQNREGSIVLGVTKNEFGFDDGSYADLSQYLAARAINAFPVLKDLNLVRSWGALRIMTEDGFPVYCESKDFPGSFVLSSHSAVTLAPNHYREIGDWIATSSSLPDDLEPFAIERFQKEKAGANHV